MNPNNHYDQAKSGTQLHFQFVPRFTFYKWNNLMIQRSYEKGAKPSAK